MAWKINKRALKALRRKSQQAMQAQLTPEDKPVEKEITPPEKPPEGKLVFQDFPAGNVADIKRTSLFLHDDHGKATKAWWANTKGIAA